MYARKYRPGSMSASKRVNSEVTKAVTGSVLYTQKKGTSSGGQSRIMNAVFRTAVAKLSGGLMRLEERATQYWLDATNEDPRLL